MHALLADYAAALMHEWHLHWPSRSGGAVRSWHICSHAFHTCPFHNCSRSTRSSTAPPSDTGNRGALPDNLWDI